jgi:hypothetical protein
MVNKKNPKIGNAQVAGGVKVQLPLDSDLIGILKTDQYDLVNLYTGATNKTYVESVPGDENLEDLENLNNSDEPKDPEVVPLPSPNLEDITLIGKTGARYSSGQTILDPDIYYDSNNNRFLKVKFEVKNSAGDLVTGVIII